MTAKTACSAFGTAASMTPARGSTLPPQLPQQRPSCLLPTGAGGRTTGPTKKPRGQNSMITVSSSSYGSTTGAMTKPKYRKSLGYRSTSWRTSTIFILPRPVPKARPGLSCTLWVPLNIPMAPRIYEHTPSCSFSWPTWASLVVESMPYAVPPTSRVPQTCASCRTFCPVISKCPSTVIPTRHSRATWTELRRLRPHRQPKWPPTTQSTGGPTPRSTS